MKKMSVSKIFSSVKTAVNNHSPEILTGVGIAGMIVTAVMAVRATPKALGLMEELKEEHEDELDNKTLMGKEILKHVAPVYIPSVITCGLSVACLIGANSVNFRRNTALATAYSLSESALKEYRAKVVETIGEKKEQEIRDEIAKDKIDKNPVTTTEVIVTGAGNTLFYDTMNDRYFQSNIERVRRVENRLNFRLRSEMFISLNDFYSELGLRCTEKSEYLGWNIDQVGEEGIQFNFSTQLITDEESIYYGQPCIVLEYNYCEPKYNYRFL